MTMPPPELTPQEVVVQYVAQLLILALAVAGAVLGIEKYVSRYKKGSPRRK
jgi:hypothetical protein